MKKKKLSSRLSNWRYWPMELLYAPLTLYVFLIGSLRAGRFFYFSATNPKVPMGGFANDSKFKILQKVPSCYLPKTIFISETTSEQQLMIYFQASGLSFPIIAKPDLGEGGFLVQKINNSAELLSYHEQHHMNYLLQEYVADPIEISVLVYQLNNQFYVSSITERIPAEVKGDGVHTLIELIAQHPCAKHRLKTITSQQHINFNKIPSIGEKIRIADVGNWDYGSTYIARKDILSHQFTNMMQTVNQQIGLFNYARYDIKCADLDDFVNGNFKILEINGVKGEPIHIYDPSYSLKSAYREIFKHWEYILQISIANQKNGEKGANFSEGIRHLYTHYCAKKQALKPRKRNE